MENNCKTCGYCKFADTQPSPGGVMLVTNYQCTNPESPSFDRTMNSITSNGRTLDSRENNSCDQWSHQAETWAIDQVKEIQEKMIKNAKPVTIEVPVGLGKTGQRKISISDVDESSTVNIKGVSNSVVMVSRNNITVNGKKVFVPSKVRNAWPNCVLQTEGQLYINGFKYNNQTGTFQRTPISFLKCIFS